MASIKKRPDGKYRARYRDPSNKEHSAHFVRRVDAEKWLATQVVKVAAGTWIDPLAGRRKFEDYARTWVDAQIQHRPTTAAITRARLEKHVIPKFGKQPLGSIQRSEVQAWVASLARSGLAGSTVKGIYRLFSQVMASAVDDRMIPSSPCHKITLPDTSRVPIVVPTDEQVAAVVGAASRYGRGLIVVAAGSGLRISELCGLTPDRVDFLRRTLTVDRQLTSQSAGIPRFGPTKTASSNRVVPIPAALTELMAAEIAQRPTDTTIFLTQKRQPWTRASLGAAWRSWCDTAGVDMHFHHLRHYYASGLIAAGQSVKVVQARLGHASAALTLDVYGHLWPADEEATRDAVEGLVGPLLAAFAD